jgi:hypothetical protein
MHDLDWVAGLNDRDLLRLNYAVADALQRIGKSRYLRAKKKEPLPANVVSMDGWRKAKGL